MRLQINFKHGKPVYLQLVDQVKAAAASGAIRPGDSLPGIRPLAEQLRVNRNTVAKAFAELEAQGVVTTEAGRGSFLANGQAAFRKDVRLKLLTEEIDQAVVQAHHLRVSQAEFVRLATDRYEQFAAQRARASEG